MNLKKQIKMILKAFKLIEPTLVDANLGNVSPELKTIEAYYTNSINNELCHLEVYINSSI